MNEIDTTLSHGNEYYLTRMSVRKLAKQCMEHLQNARPFSLTFMHDMPPHLKAKTEEQMKKSFELWANSWMAPNLLAILKKCEPKKNKKP